MVKRQSKKQSEDIEIGDVTKSRIQLKKEAHQKANIERAGEQETLKAEYLRIKDSQALLDIIKKSKGLVDYHSKIAKDGMGYKDVITPDGSTRQELVYMDHQKRVSELDKAAGIEEIIDYIERQLNQA